VGGEGTHLLLGVDIRFLSSTLDAMRFYGTDVSRRLTETLCAYAWHFLWHHEAAWTDLLYLHFTYMIRTHFCRCCCAVVGIDWLQPVVDVTVNLDAGFPVRSFLVVLLLLAFYTSINIRCFMMHMFS
jgi:hypothetical protein